MKESDLFPILSNYFIQKNYTVKGEVCGCDFIALKGEEIIIIELKKQFNTKLLYQAVRRLAITPIVYMAIFKPTAKQKMSYWTMIKSLSRRLQLGLIVVDGNNIKILTEPKTFSQTKSSKLKDKILKEFHGRKAGHNIGGTTGKKLETAYLESAIYIAALLTQLKESSAVQLQQYGGPENSYTILYHNHYGWFEKKSKGVYGVKKNVKNEIQKKHPVLWKYYFNLAKEQYK